ncbi:MAG: MBL fold metallo-hydrolase [Gemmataceae bacterium]
MASQRTRRTFLQESVAAVAGLQAARTTPGAEEQPVKHFLCITCGIQFAASEKPPANCPVCDDERQYVGWNGQQWTTLPQMQGKYHNTITKEEPDLHAIHTDPKIGIGQRAFVVRTPKGNILWDCVPHLDEATIKAVKELGGLAAVAVSHPHYYTTMVEWSHAFGKAPVYLHKADAQWVMRPDPVIQFWKGDTKELFGGLMLINTGGHFEGFQVLHWSGGAKEKGALLSGDQPQVCQDRRWVSFMYSYPNLIPLPAKAIRRITAALKPFAFSRLYGAFPGLNVTDDAKGAVERSAARYLRAIGA